jgi:hypothetical protein
MTSEPDFEALRTDPTFPRSLTFDHLVQFLIPYPPAIAFFSARIDNLRAAKSVIAKRTSDTVAIIAQAKDASPTHFSFDPLVPNRSTRQRIASHRRCRFLMAVLNDLEQFLNDRRATFAEEHLTALRQLSSLCEWLIDHPKPFTLNLQMSSVESRLAFSHPTEVKQFHYLRIAFTRDLFFLNTLPVRLFSSKERDRRFLAQYIDHAAAARKGDTYYFEPIAGEERLFLFLDSDNSPLHVLPLDDVDEESVAEWVAQATWLLWQFENSESCDRQLIISVFLVRYLFNRLHPKFVPETSVDDEFNARRDAI